MGLLQERRVKIPKITSLRRPPHSQSESCSPLSRYHHGRLPPARRRRTPHPSLVPTPATAPSPLAPSPSPSRAAPSPSSHSGANCLPVDRRLPPRPAAPAPSLPRPAPPRRPATPAPSLHRPTPHWQSRSASLAVQICLPRRPAASSPSQSSASHCQLLQNRELVALQTPSLRSDTATPQPSPSRGPIQACWKRKEPTTKHLQDAHPVYWKERHLDL
ncbi:vegetative cell wall protein gp1-like [Triticum urartu]|uniref:vegetative cell wall protein gp1-like n=1 Tax=Triticum urartu TaxID=4572 RepID=UPI0020441AF7|nr:vegetative cell wall protein gp1-like [Triticum urartu]